jgi:MoaA/NifB/PqqE/SkfB family radical SAM enzyme
MVKEIKDILQKTTKGSFCILPFIEEYHDYQGLNRFCCWAKPVERGIDINELRTKIWKGEQVPQCEQCYLHEREKNISPRLHETKIWLKDKDITEFISKWEPGDPLNPQFYDLRFSNKCNLGCISCDPTSSSLIASEFGVTIKQQQLDVDLDKVLRSKKIYLAGGEPFIIDEFLDIIHKISLLDRQPELVINTNLSRVNDKIKEDLKRIHKLTLVISVDASAKINEYHRWPLKWSKFLRNLDWAKKLGAYLVFNSVVDAISVLNISELVLLEDGIDYWNLAIINDHVLIIENLPDEYKEQVFQNFSQIKQSKFYSSNIEFKLSVDLVLKKIMQPHNTIEPLTQDAMVEYVCKNDKKRNIKHQGFLGISLAKTIS